MGSSSVWGDVWSFAVMEYDQSCDSGIFWSWWLKFMSPYSIAVSVNLDYHINDIGILIPSLL